MNLANRPRRKTALESPHDTACGAPDWLPFPLTAAQPRRTIAAAKQEGPPGRTAARSHSEASIGRPIRLLLHRPRVALQERAEQQGEAGRDSGGVHLAMSVIVDVQQSCRSARPRYYRNPNQATMAVAIAAEGATTTTDGTSTTSMTTSLIRISAPNKPTSRTTSHMIVMVQAAIKCLFMPSVRASRLAAEARTAGDVVL